MTLEAILAVMIKTAHQVGETVMFEVTLLGLLLPWLLFARGKWLLGMWNGDPKVRR